MADSVLGRGYQSLKQEAYRGVQKGKDIASKAKNVVGNVTGGREAKKIGGMLRGDKDASSK